MADPDSHSHVRRAAKVGFRKSRNGCQICKRRRVKCDEVRPCCGNCLRLNLDCTWPEAPAPSTTHDELPMVPRESNSGTQSPAAKPEPNMQTTGVLHHWKRDGNEMSIDSIFSNLDGPYDELPESRDRRLLEHRLMQNWFVNLCAPWPVVPAQEWNDLWTKKIPPMALKFDNLLYALLALSATYMLREDPTDLDLFDARQSYLISSMREQRNMVNALTSSNADAVCVASIMILVNSFAMLQERSMKPYLPPVEWMRMGKGAGTLMWMSVQAILKSDGDSGRENLAVMTIANSYPKFGADESYFDESNREEFKGLLTQALISGDIWDQETREAYEKTLSYVGSLQLSVLRGEPAYIVSRRVQAFPLIIPTIFIDFVSEKRPRALVILAYFFAAASQVAPLWWLGSDKDDVESTPKREIRAIRDVLPAEWRGQMIWPLDLIGLT